VSSVWTLKGLILALVNLIVIGNDAINVSKLWTLTWFQIPGCDKSCDGCYGDGPDMCEKCAAGYILIDKLCIGEKNEL